MIKKQIFIKTILITILALFSLLMLSANKGIEQNVKSDFELKVINKSDSSYRFLDKNRWANDEFINPNVLYAYFKSTEHRLRFIDKISNETDLKKIEFIKIKSETVEVGLQTIKYENSLELIFVSKNSVRKLMLFLQVLDVFPEITVKENESIYFTYFDLNQLKYLIRKHYKISNNFDLEIDAIKVSDFNKNLFNKLLLNFYLTNLFGEKREYKINVIPVKDSENIFKIDNNFIDFEYFKIALNGDLKLNKLNFNFIVDKNNLPVNTKIINEQKLTINLNKEVYFDLHNFDVSFIYIKINEYKHLIFLKENESTENIFKLLKHLKFNNFTLNKEFKQEITLNDDLNSLTIRKSNLINEASKVTIDYKAELEKQSNKLNKTTFDSTLTLDELKKSVLKHLSNKTIDVKIISKNSEQGLFVCEFFDTKRPDIKVKKTLYFKNTQVDNNNTNDTEKQEHESKNDKNNLFLRYKIPFIIVLLASFAFILTILISVLVWRKNRNGKKN